MCYYMHIDDTTKGTTMAITVKLSDATISLGGDFATALACVKGVPGRAYNGATKTWSVPQTLHQFQAVARGLPIDVVSSASAGRSGQHITRYGSKYSAAEWDAKRAVDALVVPSAIAARCQQREDAAWQSFVAVIGDEAKARQIDAVLQRYGSAEEAEEYGRIRFSSPARRTEIAAAWEQYLTAYLKASEEGDDWLAAETARIYDETGL